MKKDEGSQRISDQEFQNWIERGADNSQLVSLKAQAERFNEEATARQEMERVRAAAQRRQDRWDALGGFS